MAESHRQELINRYGLPPGRIVTIPNGVDIKRFQPMPRNRRLREELAISDDAPVIGIVGRLTDQKGHVYLLRALPLLLTKSPALRCLVVGDGELREELQKFAVDLGLTEHCLFLGVRHDIPEVLAAMDLLVLPSLSEGMPYVALEGMAMGKPVVATAVNGVPELIQDGVTGLLVPRKDPVALVKAIEIVLANPHVAASFGLAARRLVEQTYSTERWIDQMESLYESLVDHEECSCPHD